MSKEIQANPPQGALAATEDTDTAAFTGSSPAEAPAAKAAKAAKAKSAGAAARPAKAKVAKPAKAKAKAAKPTNGGSKTNTVHDLLLRKSGCTMADIQEATGWRTLSIPAVAKAAKLKLSKEKVAGSPTRYFATR
jgi:hypothetical protein